MIDSKEFGERIEEYNRKTITYGNGTVEIVKYHNSRIRLVGHDNGGRANKNSVISDKAQEERTKKQIYSIKRTIKGIALSNPFKWFVTLTYDPEKVDSSNYEEVTKILQDFLRHTRRKYNKYMYVIIPEMHKSGAYHLHGLLGELDANFEKATNPKNGTNIIRNGRQAYNLKDWRYGHSLCEEITDLNKASSYITKYVTKELMNNKEMFRRKRYFNSQGLSRPITDYELKDNNELNGLTPNYGLIETDSNGNNVIDVGIYNLTRNNETGELEQNRKDYIMKSKKRLSTEKLRDLAVDSPQTKSEE